jgi:hypothetical protein
MLSGKQMEEAMGMLIIRHKVKDYGKWRPMFDKHSLMQKAAGLSNPRVFRSADDRSEIVVVFDTKDTKRAKDFAASPDLRETMAKAGVMDDPTSCCPAKNSVGYVAVHQSGKFTIARLSGSSLMRGCG